MTGCKFIDQAIEATRYIQMHLQYIQEVRNIEVYGIYPHANRVDVCMINYNFSLGVAIDLTDFDIFIEENYPKFAYSPYDANICNDTLPMKVPNLAINYTIHDNGRVSICSNERDVDMALKNVNTAFDAFYMILNEFHDRPT